MFSVEPSPMGFSACCNKHPDECTCNLINRHEAIHRVQIVRDRLAGYKGQMLVSTTLWHLDEIIQDLREI